MTIVLKNVFVISHITIFFSFVPFFQVYFGGRGRTSCFRDLHALDTSSHTWCQEHGKFEMEHGGETTAIRLPIFCGTKQCKNMSNLLDFPKIVHCLNG